MFNRTQGNDSYLQMSYPCWHVVCFCCSMVVIEHNNSEHHRRGNHHHDTIEVCAFIYGAIWTRSNCKHYGFDNLKVVISGWRPKEYSHQDPVQSFNFPWLQRSYFLFPFMASAALQGGIKWNKQIKIRKQIFLLNMAVHRLNTICK